MGGFEVLRGHPQTNDVPVLMLTALGMRLTGLSALKSARTTISQNLSTRELLARAASVTRRAVTCPSKQAEELVVGPLPSTSRPHRVLVPAAEPDAASLRSLPAWLQPRRVKAANNYEMFAAGYDVYDRSSSSTSPPAT